MENKNNTNNINAENYLNGYLDYYEGKSILNKKRYSAFVVLNIVISALIPFATLFIDVYIPAKYIVAMMGSTITIISALNSTFGYHKHWIEYRTVAESLKHQKVLYMNNCYPYNVENKGELLILMINSILELENRNWKSIELNLIKSAKT